MVRVSARATLTNGTPPATATAATPPAFSTSRRVGPKPLTSFRLLFVIHPSLDRGNRAFLTFSRARNAEIFVSASDRLAHEAEAPVILNMIIIDRVHIYCQDESASFFRELC